MIIVNAKCLEYGWVLLTVIDANADFSDGLLFCLWQLVLDMTLTKHVIDQLIHTDAFTAPHPVVHLLIYEAHCLCTVDQCLSQPCFRYILIGGVNVYGIWAALHLLKPCHNRRVGVLWWIK